MDKYQLCESLIKWLHTFNITAPHKTVNDISDGVAMAQALAQIAPEQFNKDWLSKIIKTDVSSNWRLKVSNLKKILEGIVDYYQDHLNRHLVIKPDLVKIGEKCDAAELSCLLQLLLGCAIYCNKKEDYITKIMAMEESVQQVIMQAIQELEQLWLISNTPISSMNQQDYARMITELEEARDHMAQQCHELDIQVNLLQEEKTVIISENKRLQDKLQELEAAEDSGASFRAKSMRNEIIKLKEEVLKMETSRDDYRLKLEQQEKEFMELQSKVDDLQKMADEARHLKDEVDILRETADKVAKCEATISSYKKKLEEYSDLKRQVKVLEDKNNNYMQQIMELEEELKKCGTWKSQLEVYKKQNAELHQKLNEETKQVDRKEFDNKKLQEKLSSLTLETQRLRAELDKLKETNEELVIGNTKPANSNTEVTSTLGIGFSDNIISPDIVEKLNRLEEENRNLRMSQQKQRPEEDKLVLQTLYDDAQQQIKQLLQDNRVANQRIIELDNKLEEQQDTTTRDLRPRISELQEKIHAIQAEKEQKITQLEERDALILDFKQRIATQKEILKRKDAEILLLEERYKKSIEKAKSVLQSLDPKTSSNSVSVAEMQALKDQLSEKHKIIEDLEEEKEQNKSCREMEEKLMTSAFYKLGLMKQRESVDQRLSTLSLSQGHSFLARQRQASSRRSGHNFESR